MASLPPPVLVLAFAGLLLGCAAELSSPSDTLTTEAHSLRAANLCAAPDTAPPGQCEGEVTVDVTTEHASRGPDAGYSAATAVEAIADFEQVAADEACDCPMTLKDMCERRRNDCAAHEALNGEVGRSCTVATLFRYTRDVVGRVTECRYTYGGTAPDDSTAPDSCRVLDTVPNEELHNQGWKAVGSCRTTCAGWCVPAGSEGSLPRETIDEEDEGWPHQEPVSGRGDPAEPRSSGER